MKALPRLLLAMALMTAVFVVTNRMFPPVLPEPAVESPPETSPGGAPEGEAIDFGQEMGGVAEEADPPSEAGLPEGLVRDEEIVTVETPLMRVVLSSRGPTVRSVELLEYESLASGGGPVQLVPHGIETLLAGTWRVGSGSDELDLTRLSHSVSPADGLRLTGPGESATLTFRYEHPSQPFVSELRYTFTSDSYIVGVEGRLPARARSAIFVDLGVGPAVNELREADDRAMMAFSAKHVSEGIRSRPFGRVKEPEAVTGPLSWAAVKSKYFVKVILAGGGEGEGTLAGLWAEPILGIGRAAVRVAMPIETDGSYRYRAYLGPIDRDRLSAIGDDLQEVNPVGWAFFRPIIKPFVAVALWAMRMLHDHVGLTYGWVLIAIGVLVRVVLWPLNQKAMRSQLKNMAAAPLLEEIKQKYGKDPQKMQQETLKLYKEQGINPLAGCVPLLIPWPMLLALFFVFQNTIQLRGQSFLWLQDLSAPDPFYVLPVFMAASLFLVQRISMKSMATVNPQMKMMMYILPIVLLFVFWRFASGLNLYYAAFNVATIPQQMLIARERRRAQAEGVVPAPGPKRGRELGREGRK